MAIDFEHLERQIAMVTLAILGFGDDASGLNRTVAPALEKRTDS